MRLFERIDPKQVEQAAGILSTTPAQVLRYVARFDPTVGEHDAPEDILKRSVYGQWILKQTAEEDRADKDSRWLKTLAATHRYTRDELSRETLMVAGRQHDHFLPTPAKLRAILTVLEKIRKLPASQRRNLNISTDINSYRGYRDLEDKLKDASHLVLLSRRALKRGKVEPEKVQGAAPVYQGDEFLVYMARDGQTAADLAAPTSWCFANLATAEEYTSAGPLFFVYRRRAPGDETGVGEETVQTLQIGESEWDLIAAASFTSNNTPYEGVKKIRKLFEIRDVSNGWLDARWSKRIGLTDILGELYREYAPEGTGLGFSVYADGRDAGYHLSDIPEYSQGTTVSHEARTFAYNHRFDIVHGKVVIPNSFWDREPAERRGVTQHNVVKLTVKYPTLVRINSSNDTGIGEYGDTVVDGSSSDPALWADLYTATSFGRIDEAREPRSVLRRVMRGLR